MKYLDAYGWSWRAGAAFSLVACSGPSGSPGPSMSDATAAGDAAGMLDAAFAPETGPETSTEASSDGASLGGYPAPHASLPRVETFGGPVLSAPKVIPVFFANDPFESQIEQFLTQLEGSSYWTATTSEYGVGTLQIAPSIVVPDPAPSSITNSQIASWLAGYLDGTHPEWPGIDNKNVYVVFYPQATTITQSSGETSCIDFGGYHTEGNEGPAVATGEGGTQADGASDDAAGEGGTDAARALGPSFLYAVVPRCTTFSGLTGIDLLTAVLSHELVEAATDPFTRTNPAYKFVDFDHVAWALALGGSPFVGEVGDLCLSESPDRRHQRLVGNFLVQRTWSNRSAASNRDPCVPPIPDVYFGAAPEFDELAVVANGDAGGPLSVLLTSGAKLAVGQSRTLGVRLFSTGPVPDWYVSVFQHLAAPGAPATLQTTLDKSSGNNGDVLTLRVKRIADGPTSGGTEIILFSSATPVTANAVPLPWNAWYGFVQN